MNRLMTLCAACGLLAGSLFGEPMKKGERERLIAHLEMTGAWLADEVRGLSQKQLDFKPTPESWSVLNVVEHLTIAEPQYWQWLQEAAKSEPHGQKLPVTDDQILWYGIDRTRRSKTADERAAKGELKDLKKGLEQFDRLRAAMLEYARTTEDDLRARRYQKADMDAYQWFLMISTHSQRHILQIREIKHHPDFPKS
jgi:hypothetical protein